MEHIITIDGSYGEGGGQIVRTCLSLAALTGRAVNIENMRAGRSKPGLQPQHLASVRAAAALCAARTEGDAVGSTRLLFAPQSPVQPGAYRYDIGTAGATGLVAQTVALPLALSGGRSRVTITGGTHVPHAPPAEYLEHVYFPTLRASGPHVDFAYPRAGWFPKGGGEALLHIEPATEVRPLALVERGALERLTAFIITSGLPGHVGERGAAAVEAFMRGVGRRVAVEQRAKPSIGMGAAVVVVAQCAGGWGGFTAMGERGKPMEDVARAACEGFMGWWKSGAACDERLADQLALPLALARGESQWTTPRVSSHLRTVLWLLPHFLPVEPRIEERGDGGLVTLRGAG